MTTKNNVLEVEGLYTVLQTPRGPVTVVDDVNLVIEANASVGIVGESGSGKTMLSKSLMNLLPARGSIESRRFEFVGESFDPSRPPSKHFWGTEISMVFQDPMTALNPVRTVGAQIIDPLRVHLGLTKKQSKARAIELLGHVGIPAPQTRLEQYPHEMSGGMRQRVMIAIAIACEPQLLIADEPTTGLDVTVQRQILTLLRRLKDEHGMALMLISHDIALLSDEVDHVNVMYGGTLLESVDVVRLREKDVRHRYTEALLRAHPDVNAPAGTRLESIPGGPPDLFDMPQGCRYAPRCDFAGDICRTDEPEFAVDRETGTRYACHYPHTIEPLAVAAAKERT